MVNSPARWRLVSARLSVLIGIGMSRTIVSCAITGGTPPCSALAASMYARTLVSRADNATGGPSTGLSTSTGGPSTGLSTSTGGPSTGLSTSTGGPSTGLSTSTGGAPCSKPSRWASIRAGWARWRLYPFCALQRAPGSAPHSEQPTWRVASRCTRWEWAPSCRRPSTERQCTPTGASHQGHLTDSPGSKGAVITGLTRQPRPCLPSNIRTPSSDSVSPAE